MKPFPSILVTALVLWIAWTTPAGAGCPAQPTRCGDALRIYDTEGRLDQYDTVLIVWVEQITDRDIKLPWDLGDVLYRVTYYDRAMTTGCDKENEKLHVFIGNACWSDPEIGRWPGNCDSGFIMFAEPRPDLLVGDFLLNCCQGHYQGCQ